MLNQIDEVLIDLLKQIHEAITQRLECTEGFPNQIKRKKSFWEFTFDENDWVKIAKSLLILSDCYDHFQNGTSSTLREMFYRHRQFIKSPTDLSQTVNLVCQTLNTPRSALKIYATAKGAVVGPIALIQDSIKSVSGRRPIMITEPMSNASDITIELTVPIDRIWGLLVVEKDCILQYINDSFGPGDLNFIMVTGGGYPDIATRTFIQRLLRQFGFVAGYIGDFDPFGVSIYMDYRRGSNLAMVSQKMTQLPNLQWLGVCEEDILLLQKVVFLPLTPKEYGRIDKLNKDVTRLPEGYNKRAIVSILNYLYKEQVKCEFEALVTIRDNEYMRELISQRLGILMKCRASLLDEEVPSIREAGETDAIVNTELHDTDGVATTGTLFYTIDPQLNTQY